MALIVYGLADRRLAGSELGEVIEMFVDRAEAERILNAVVWDEPSWADELCLVGSDLASSVIRGEGKPDGYRR